MEVTPALILAMWTAGMAGGAAVVGYWRIVGPGFTWLMTAVIVAVGGATALAGDTVLGLIATAAALMAGLMARRPGPAAGLLSIAAVGYLVVAVDAGGLIPAVTGTVLLGGMTTEMALGHWFLVDPRLPRSALQRLDLSAGVGLALDGAAMALLGAAGSGDGVLLAAFVGLAIMSALLVAGVWFSLREPSYSGVMAATGLSYLGVLTAFGVVVVGRLLVAGL